jgi:hypothetical protein
MRKQDRILRDREMNHPHDESGPGESPRPEREQMRNREAVEQAPKPPRESGKLPLPE